MKLDATPFATQLRFAWALMHPSPAALFHADFDESTKSHFSKASNAAQADNGARNDGQTKGKDASRANGHHDHKQQAADINIAFAAVDDFTAALPCIGHSEVSTLPRHAKALWCEGLNLPTPTSHLNESTRRSCLVFLLH